MMIAFCVDKESLGSEHSCHDRILTGSARVVSTLHPEVWGILYCRSCFCHEEIRLDLKSAVKGPIM